MSSERWDRNSAEYQICLKLATVSGFVVGAATGSFAGGPAGTLLGGAEGAGLGLAMGYLACPAVGPFLRDKILNGFALSHDEVHKAATALQSYASTKTPEETIRLLAHIRQHARLAKKTPASKDPAYSAKHMSGILKQNSTSSA